MYSYANGSEYVALVEQGSLFFGDGIIEQQIAKHPGANIIAPSGTGTPQPLQTGILIFRTSIVPEFIHRYASIPNPDGGNNGLSPEKKVARVGADIGLVLSDLPSGRSRPLQFEASHMFVRHATTQELQRFIERVGLQELPLAPVIKRL
jgi:hypothetical protein